ncbi:MAG: hypothetical protein R6V55_06250 [Desulfovermiculus sp.]
MNNCLHNLQLEAKKLKSHNLPSFYDHYAPELAHSRETFFDHPLIQRCREDAIPFLHDQYGHGIEHSKNVAVESGALILAETVGWDIPSSRHLMLLAQVAGLLHDTCRLESDHAQQGAQLSRKILQDYPFSEQDKDMIALAIANHEAFKANTPACDPAADLLSNALYDGDKFRWGPDNFVTTLWEICDYEEWSLDKIMERFPRGLQIVQSISETFRTATGQIYGPEFISCGLHMGQHLYRRLKHICS